MAYQNAVSKHSCGFVDLTRDCLVEGHSTLKKQLEQLSTKLISNDKQSLAGQVERICMELQKIASQFRLGNTDRPSSSSVPFDSVREVAKKYSKTLAEELKSPQQHLSLVAKEKLTQQLQKKTLAMNDNKLHTFWSKMARGKANVQMFANLFEMPHIAREELNAWCRAESVRNVYDVQTFQMVCVLNSVRDVWVKELVPLLSDWLASAVHDSFSCAFDVVLASKEFALLRENKRFTDALRTILKVSFFKRKYFLHSSLIAFFQTRTFTMMMCVR